MRTVIAGYHWFTDWGRDTMISLEGLDTHHQPFLGSRLDLTQFRQCDRQG